MDEWRLSTITLGAPAFPLVVLFGLNAVDELDRTAFAVLLPDIRDLPESLSPAAFTERYGAIGSPAYQRLLADIELRLDRLPLYR